MAARSEIAQFRVLLWPQQLPCKASLLVDKSLVNRVRMDSKIKAKDHSNRNWVLTQIASESSSVPSLRPSTAADSNPPSGQPNSMPSVQPSQSSKKPSSNPCQQQTNKDPAVSGVSLVARSLFQILLAQHESQASACGHVFVHDS